MKLLTSQEIFELLNKETKVKRTSYREKEHCTMILDILPRTWRISAFCKEALICEATFYLWVNSFPLFEKCYKVAQVFAQENWEKEYEDNHDNPEWDKREWFLKGSRYFAKKKDAIFLKIDNQETPWIQYQQILKQAGAGDFTASEIKQLMESVNVGTRVYESFKLQQEVDKMNKELSEMSQRNANNISTNCETKTTD